SALGGGVVPWYAFVVKSAFTSVTLNFGGSGGIVTPIFFVGATSGTLFAQIFGLHAPTFAALGPYAAVACVISYLMTGHRSVCPSQVLAIKKSSATEVELGKEIEGAQPEYHPEGRDWIVRGSRLASSVREHFRHGRPRS
ncbi:MAG: chloride channel protein, partial [Thermoanaerobaculaceae bacterium]